MRIFIVICLLILPHGAFANYDINKANEAYEIYTQAQKALDEGRLVDAERLAKAAIAKHPKEGGIKIGATKTFVFDRHTRQTREVVIGQHRDYLPSEIVQSVVNARAANANLVRISAKQAHPPKLNLSLRINDQSGEGIVHAYEQLELTLTVKNEGESSAEALKGYLFIQNMNMRFPFTLDVLSAGREHVVTQTLTVPHDVSNRTTTIQVEVLERDGFDVKQTFSAKTRAFRIPRYTLTSLDTTGNHIVPGRQARTVFKITNTGKDPLFDVHLVPGVNDTRALKVAQAKTDSIDMLLPGQSNVVILDYHVTQALGPNQKLPLLMQLNTYGYEGKLSATNLYTTAIEYANDAQWAQLKRDQHNSEHILMPLAKTLLLCVETAKTQQQDNCEQLQSNVGKAWREYGHQFAIKTLSYTKILNYLTQIRSTLDEHDVKQLIVYVASAESNVNGQTLMLTKALSLSEFSRRLSKLFDGPMQLWLETSFSGRSNPLSVAIMPNINKLPANMQLVVAATPYQHNQQDLATTQGVFTDALQTYFRSASTASDSAQLMQGFVTFFETHYAPSLPFFQSPWHRGAPNQDPIIYVKESL